MLIRKSEAASSSTLVTDQAQNVYELVIAAHGQRPSELAEEYSRVSDPYFAFQWVNSIGLNDFQWHQILSGLLGHSHSNSISYEAAQLITSGKVRVYQLPSMKSAGAIPFDEKSAYQFHPSIVTKYASSPHRLEKFNSVEKAQALVNGIKWSGSALARVASDLRMDQIIQEKIIKNGSSNLEFGKQEIIKFLSEEKAVVLKVERITATPSKQSAAELVPLRANDKPPQEAPATSAKNEPQQRSQDKSSKVIAHSEPAKVSAAATTGAASTANTCTNGCPISMISGEELLELQDFILPGPITFKWKRTYRSGHDRNVGMGHGWTHTACEQLFEKDNRVELSDHEGRILGFKRPAIHQTSELINERLSLEALEHNTYALRQLGQPHKIFRRVGNTEIFRLTQIQHIAYKAADVNGQSEQGFTLSFIYGEENSLSKILGNWGKELQFVRDGSGHIVQVKLLDEKSAKTRVVAEYEYSDENDLIAHRDGSGRGEVYEYSNHLFTRRTLVTGFSYYYEWDGTDSNARCIHTWGDKGIYDYRFSWNPENNLTKSTDSRGFTKEYQYNEFGLITQEIDNEGGIHRYTYENGLRTSYTDPEGNVTAYTYDAANNLIGVIDALDQSQTRHYSQGKLTSSTDKDGAVWLRTYNAQGLLETLTAPDGQVARYSYNAQYLLTQKTDASGKVTHYQWNDAGELIALINAEGHKQSFTYNDWGQVTQMDVWLASRQHGGTTRYFYNASNELIRIIYPSSERVDIAYNANGQIERVSDRRGRVTRYEYDGLSQVIRRIDAESNSLAYEYDTERNLVRLTNENGDDYQFFYDGNERLIKEIGFDGRTQHYKYNAAGHLIKHLDAGEIVTEFERDPLGRMLSKTSRALSQNTIGDNKANELNRYLYDSVGRLKETYNDHQYIAFEYDRGGQLISEHHSDLNAQRQRISDSMVDIHYQRHASGQLKKIQLPNDQTIDYQYDANDRFHKAFFNDNAIATIERDTFGFETYRQQGSLTTYSDYDPMGRLVKQRTEHLQQKTGVIQREYQYDDFGNLSVYKEGMRKGGVGKDDTWEVRYVYDMVDRLKRTQGDLIEDFVFDPAGNLLAQQKKEQGKTTKGNRLTLQGDRKFEYDARGNLIRETRGKGGKLETIFEYNFNNQLCKVIKDGQVTEYTYDPIGRRIRKQDNFGVTHYLWAGDQLAQEKRNNIQKTYIYEPESFKPIAMVQDGEIYHYHLDHLGTPRELTNQQGKLVWKARYKTYGNVAVKDVEEIENNLRFQGQYFDEETGLHYNRHRYYDPSIGQFTTQDPIGLLGGINNYQYAPNPTGWVDPLGLSCKEAKIHVAYRPNSPVGHNLIGIEMPGEDIRWFDLVMTEDPGGTKGLIKGGQSTMLREQSKISKNYQVSTRTVDLNSAQKMLDKAQIMKDSGTGPYNLLSNSCTSAVCDILEAGNVNPSWWAKTPSLIYRWF